MIEPRLRQVTCTENFVKFGRVVCETYEQTDRQTDRQTDTLIATLCSNKLTSVKQLRMI